MFEKNNDILTRMRLQFKVLVIVVYCTAGNLEEDVLDGDFPLWALILVTQTYLVLQWLYGSRTP